MSVVCWLWGKENMVNKYSWGLCVEDMINEYNQKVLEYLKNWKNLEVKYQTQFSEIRYENSELLNNLRQLRKFLRQT